MADRSVSVVVDEIVDRAFVAKHGTATLPDGYVRSEKAALRNGAERFGVPAMVEALYRCVELSGEDTSDGIPTEPGLAEWAVREVGRLRDESDGADERVVALEDALAFYADPLNWRVNHRFELEQRVRRDDDNDGGERARAVLGGEVQGRPPQRSTNECPTCGAPPNHPCNADAEGVARDEIHPERLAASTSNDRGDE